MKKTAVLERYVKYCKCIEGRSKLIQ
jgi:hypothetical protein